MDRDIDGEHAETTVAGATDVTLTAAEARNQILGFTGTLRVNQGVSARPSAPKAITVSRNGIWARVVLPGCHPLGARMACTSSHGFQSMTG